MLYTFEIVQDDIQKLKDNKEQLRDEIGLVEKRLTDLKQNLSEVKASLGETGWEVKQKNGEIAMLKNQLKEVLTEGREAQNQVDGRQRLKGRKCVNEKESRG
jgi:chromosome segregation ATPase